MYRIIVALCVLTGTNVLAQRVAPGVAPQHYQQPPQQHQQHPPPPQQYQQVPQHQQQHQPQHQLPPGVNPQHYPPQQQQQVQYQQQQVPVHQQQLPVQQVPVVQQQQHQQVPVQQHQQQQQHHQQVPQGHGVGGGGHHAPHATHGQVLNAANMAHEKDHIQEHLHVPIDTSKMSEAELQFHYFKMHDSDNNNKLDGCELIKSLIHWHADEPKKKENETHVEDGEPVEKDFNSYTDENLSEVIDYVLNSMDLNKDGYVDYTEYRKSEEESAKSDNPE